MNPSVEVGRALVLAGAMVMSVCHCKDHGEPTAPALWEPIDEGFKGCEGG